MTYSKAAQNGCQLFLLLEPEELEESAEEVELCGDDWDQYRFSAASPEIDVSAYFA